MKNEIKIKVTMINTNGNKKFLYNGYSSKRKMLMSMYKDQGEFYEKVLGVSRKDAEDAGWCPQVVLFESSEDFCLNNIKFHEYLNKNFNHYGWEKMLKDGGVIKQTKASQLVELKELIFDDY